MPPHQLNPQALVAVSAALKTTPGITAAELVELAKQSTGPLHSAFEWDDTKAAHRFRLDIANKMIVRVKVRVTLSERATTRVTVAQLRPDNAPQRNLRVLTSSNSNDPRSRDLQQAIQELEAFRRKYSTISELAGVFVALEELKDPKKGVLRRAVEAAKAHETKGYTRPEAASLAAQAFKLPMAAVLDELRATA